MGRASRNDTSLLRLPVHAGDHTFLSDAQVKPDLSDAEFALAVANTPLFLLRKLREDEASRNIAIALPEAEIFRRMKQRLARKPKDLRERVEPYVYLVAL